tara:strand:- start:35285 stop:36394 length:1110 start_codon:yes stop_codon:yes gene_type:complete
MAKEEINIPDDVVNEEAYLKYLKIRDSKALKQGTRMISTSDISLVIDPLFLLDIIKDYIKNLPSEEQIAILERVKVVKILNKKKYKYKSDAFGKKSSPALDVTAGESGVMFLDERSSEVLEYFGRYLSIDEVLKILYVEWGIDVNRMQLTKFHSDHKDKIVALQETFRKDTNNVRLSHKRGRLEELSFLYGDRREKYEVSRSRAEADMMLKILKQVKDEMHINTLNIKGEVTHKIQHTVAEHIEREIMGSLAINDIIIARAAFRMGVNPALLINRLHNSIYAKFSGFNVSSQDFMSEEVKYPSTMVYDWRAIAKKHKDKDAVEEYTEFDEIPEKEVPNIRKIREELKKKAAERKGVIDKVKDNVDKKTK